MTSMALMMKKLKHLSMTMPKGSSTSILRMFVTSSPMPPAQGGTPNQENTMQEMTSDVNPESNNTSRGIASSTTEHVIETAEEMGEQAQEMIQDAWSSAKETAESKAHESKETIKDCAERVKRAMNTKERI